MKVFSALKDDVHQGWVWLENTSLPPRGVICITNLSNGKRIYCEALQIDGNFLKTTTFLLASQLPNQKIQW